MQFVGCCSKKHSVHTKEEMENAVGLSRMKDAAALTQGAAVEAGGENTVCKYCGEDFKFYRSLKHHLRSESSCSRKPFTCRDCGLGFSTKANCLRHIQKQHALVAGATVESRMTVNEVLLEAGKDRGADKVRRLDMTSAAVNGGQLPKHEQMDISASDEPLDFSLKTMESRSHSFVPVSAASDDDEPMDLSIGAARSRSTSAADRDASEFECSSPLSLVIASRQSSLASQSAESASESSMMCKRNVTKAPLPYQCTHCHAVFARSSKVQRRSLFLYPLFVIFLLYMTVAHFIILIVC